VDAWAQICQHVHSLVNDPIIHCSRGPINIIIPFLLFFFDKRGHPCGRFNLVSFLHDAFIVGYPWIKALHIVSVISWMAGLFYLPRLFVHHAERADRPGDLHDTFVMMEYKLLRVIMNPAMLATWVFGLILVMTPGIVDWSALWPWVKAGGVLVMTWFHHWLGLRRKEFAAGENSRNGRTYRIMNEVPTLLMLVIVFSVVIKY
jgi:protoporphyrinogen IX oxidase